MVIEHAINKIAEQMEKISRELSFYDKINTIPLNSPEHRYFTCSEWKHYCFLLDELNSLDDKFDLLIIR